MARVYLSIGSNIDRERNVRTALAALRRQFGSLDLSSVYESEAVGFEGDPFLNMVVGLDTELALSELSLWLKNLELSNGRQPNTPRFSPKSLDIDILTYADWVGEFDGVVLPREEITYNAFVLWPLSEIAGEHLHPVLSVSYAQLWREFDRERQRLWPVPFSD